MEQDIITTLSRNDRDLLIETRTLVKSLSDDIKQFNNSITALEIRVRALEMIKSEALGGWRTMLIAMGTLAGTAGLIISLLNYFAHTR